MYMPEVIEYAAYLYLRTMPLNNTVDIVRAWYNREVLTKSNLLGHLETLIDRIPDFDQVTLHFKPERSGYYAFDGLWIKCQGQNAVLLICLDVQTLDLVNYHIADDENYQTYGLLIDKINLIEPGLLERAKGFFLDGELGLLKQLKEKYSSVPKQLCAFHKYTRVGQIIPLKRIRGINKEIKVKVEAVIFALSKQEAEAALKDLKLFAHEHQENENLKKIIGVLKRNFDLLLTHFDHPEMSPYNNVLEGFNHILNRKFLVLKGFKTKLNMHRFIKLLLLDYRFHTIKTSNFANRNQKSPLQLANVNLPTYYNWITFLRKNPI